MEKKEITFPCNLKWLQEQLCFKCGRRYFEVAGSGKCPYWESIRIPLL